MELTASHVAFIYLSHLVSIIYYFWLGSKTKQNYLVKPLLMKDFGKYRLSCSAYFTEKVLEEVSSPLR